MPSQIITGLTKNNALSKLRDKLEVANRAQVVWLLFLQAGYKRAVLGTMILSNGQGRSKWTTFKGGPKYSGRTDSK